MAFVHRRYWLVPALLALGVTAMPRAARPQTSATEALRREMDEMKKQMRALQERIKKQEAVIEKLSAQPPVPAEKAGKATATPAAPTISEADEERIKRQVTENVMRKVQPSLASALKTFPSQFNPAIGLILDNVASYSTHDHGNFDFRSAEIGISASVDPFARGYAIFNGTSDGVEVEEAAIVTTSLPYNLTVKGGRYFADFGRLSKFHDHDLPFVNRPIVLDEYVDGESQAQGVEGSWLVPIPHYLTLTAGAYNKIGAENERVDNAVPRDLDQFTYLGRAATYFNLTDSQSLDLGGTWAGTPVVAVDHGEGRNLAGLDLTYRYIPPSQASYRGLIWGTELLVNSENRPVGGFPESEADVAGASLARGLGLPSSLVPARAAPAAPAPLDFERKNAAGLYTYLEARLSRRFYPGFLFQWVQDIDPEIDATLSYSPYLTVWASEFQRLRLQYTRLEAPSMHDNEFFLQWTVILGSHVHSFRDR